MELEESTLMYINRNVPSIGIIDGTLVAEMLATWLMLAVWLLSKTTVRILTGPRNSCLSVIIKDE